MLENIITGRMKEIEGECDQLKKDFKKKDI